MKNYFSSSRALITAALVLAAMLLIATGCTTTPPQPATVAAPQADITGGTKLWAQNCGHCHNIRSPSSYSDSQWDVVAFHMRIRANLTAEEHRKILAFLKSAH